MKGLDVGPEDLLDDKPEPKEGEGDDKGKGEKPKAKEPEGVTLSKKEHAELIKRIGELEGESRFWADKARGQAAKPEPDEDDGDEDEEDDDEPEDENPDAVADDFATKGIEALVKRGVLTKKAAKALIIKEATRVAEKIAREKVSSAEKRLAMDSALMRDFPDLGDEKSPLFERTGAILREMVAEDASLRKSAAALRAAARAAKREIDAEGKRKPAEDDKDRLDRIRRQAGDRGDRGRSELEDGDEDVGPETKRMLDRLKVTEDDFRAERKAARR